MLETGHAGEGLLLHEEVLGVIRATRIAHELFAVIDATLRPSISVPHVQIVPVVTISFLSRQCVIINWREVHNFFLKVLRVAVRIVALLLLHLP